MPDRPELSSIVTRSPLTTRELRALIAAEVRAQLASIHAANMAAIAELRDDLHEELAALDRRITAVHEKALRALTDEANRKGGR